MNNEVVEQEMVYPEGVDLQLLKELQLIAMEKRKEQFEKEHAEFMQTAETKAESLTPLVKMLDLDPRQVEEAVAEIRKAMHDRLSKEEPPPFEPEKGHNPVRYPPYDMSWTSISCGGITYCYLRNNASTGRIGANLGIFNAGGASSVSSVGFWYYAAESGTLAVTINSSVWGIGYVFSGLFGYASAYAGLRAYVERYSSDFTTYSATTDIYDNWGVLEFDWHEFNWVGRSVSISVPLRAGTWYAIWADAVQNAYAGGIADSVSNFAMYANTVIYSVY